MERRRRCTGAACASRHLPHEAPQNRAPGIGTRTCEAILAAATAAPTVAVPGQLAARCSTDRPARRHPGNETKSDPCRTDRGPCTATDGSIAAATGRTFARCTMGIPGGAAAHAAADAAAATGGRCAESYGAAGSRSTIGFRDAGGAAVSPSRRTRPGPEPPCRRTTDRTGSAAAPDGGRRWRGPSDQRSWPKTASRSRWSCFMRSRRASLNARWVSSALRIKLGVMNTIRLVFWSCVVRFLNR